MRVAGLRRGRGGGRGRTRGTPRTPHGAQGTARPLTRVPRTTVSMCTEQKLRANGRRARPPAGHARRRRGRGLCGDRRSRGRAGGQGGPSGTATARSSRPPGDGRPPLPFRLHATRSSEQTRAARDANHSKCQRNQIIRGVHPMKTELKSVVRKRLERSANVVEKKHHPPPIHLYMERNPSRNLRNFC